jgi:hypothetical protein
MVKVMFTSFPVPFFREFIFKTNLMRNQEKPDDVITRKQMTAWNFLWY